MWSEGSSSHCIYGYGNKSLPLVSGGRRISAFGVQSNKTILQ